MKHWFILLLLVTSNSGIAQLEEDDSIMLTLHLQNIIKQGWFQPSIDTANFIINNESITEDTWRDFFNEFFQTNPYNDNLKGWFGYPLFWWYTETIHYNLQHALIDVFTALADRLMDSHSSNLGASLENNKDLRETIMNCHRTMNEFSRLQVPSVILQDKFLNFYEIHVNRHAQFFKKSETIDINLFPYVGTFREQIFFNLMDYLRIHPEVKSRIESITGIRQSRIPYQQIWDDFEIMVVDNNQLKDRNLEVIHAYTSLIPSELYILKIISVQQHLRKSSEQVLWNLGLGGVNIFGDLVGAVRNNPFSTDIEPYFTDGFTEALAHEFNHQVDWWYISHFGERQARKNQLIAQAGLTDENYLRSMVGGQFFHDAPQEFFASMANQYMINTERTFELALKRLGDGYTEPMNQFLFFADVYSTERDSTYFYQVDTEGNISRSAVPIERDESRSIENPITGLLWKGQWYRFILDDDINVVRTEITTSSDDSFNENSISVYPNPVSDYLTIRDSEFLPSNKTVAIYDIQGRKMSFEIIGSHSGLIVDVRSLQKGIYWLFLEKTNRYQPRRFIKI